MSNIRKQFYAVDLLLHIIKRKNIGILIYLVLNVGILATIPYLFCKLDPNSFIYTPKLSLLFVGLYFIISFFLLSPIGESFVCWYGGYKKFKKKNIYHQDIKKTFEPLLNQAISKSQREFPDVIINNKIKLRLLEDIEPTMFAVGRNTICITTGLYSYYNKCRNDNYENRDEIVKSLFYHTFYRISSHDTDILTLVAVGNFLVTIIAAILKFVIDVIDGVLQSSTYSYEEEKRILYHYKEMYGRDEYYEIYEKDRRGIICTLLLGLITLIMFIWTKIGILLSLGSRKKTELEADMFACKLSSYYPLLNYLYFIKKHEDILEKKDWLDKMDICSIIETNEVKAQIRIDNIENKFDNQIKNALYG